MPVGAGGGDIPGVRLATIWLATLVHANTLLDSPGDEPSGALTGRRRETVLAVGKVVVERAFGCAALLHDLVQPSAIVAVQFHHVTHRRNHLLACRGHLLASLSCHTPLA